ncbi:MAG: GTPase Era [Deltaproteobacteria bacterium]|nr:GTPase Era [Deltaproteobacteria bacterium]
MSKQAFKSGFVSIIGRPNVGKSTLLNEIVGEKLSIITNKPQTTRNRITGIKNIDDAQIVFWDTPGIHKARDLMNKVMVKAAISTISEVDIIVFVIEANKISGSGDDFIINLLKEAGKPVILVINKIDLVKKGELLPVIDDLSSRFDFRHIIPLSAKKGEGVESLLENIKDILKEGPRFFSDDQLTDLPERFIVSEIIREKLYRSLRDEVPYSTAVEIEEFTEKESKNVLVIKALIYVERDSQKRIIIGKKGAMMREIGTAARKDIEALLGAKVFLEIFVKVKSGWSSSDRMLKELGID